MQLILVLKGLLWGSVWGRRGKVVGYFQNFTFFFHVEKIQIGINLRQSVNLQHFSWPSEVWRKSCKTDPKKSCTVHVILYFFVQLKRWECHDCSQSQYARKCQESCIELFFWLKYHTLARKLMSRAWFTETNMARGGILISVAKFLIQFSNIIELVNIYKVLAMRRLWKSVNY